MSGAGDREYVMDDATKDRIDAMGYEEMLRLWRNAAVGHPMFMGDTGSYFSKRMAEKRDEAGDGAAVSASKSVGWDSQ